MPRLIKGPAIFLAQFMGDKAPFNNLPNICKWAAGLGYKGIQLPSWDKRIIDVEKAAGSQAYCEEILGIVHNAGLQITELATHLQGQLMAVHPVDVEGFSAFAPESAKGNPKALWNWAHGELMFAATASQKLGLTVMPSFTGTLMWQTVYPWPQRPQGLVETGFKELARRWMPILNHCKNLGISVAWEVHPKEDVHDGASYEMMLAACEEHEAACLLYDPSHFVLQCLDYIDFINIYHSRIRAFHVKDAEFRPNGRSGVYGGYQDWKERPGRFRSLGDGQVDFGQIFSLLTKYNIPLWAVLEWECCFKGPEQGAAEGAPFIARHLITPPERAFDDFAATGADEAANRRALGLET